jgi:uncharacterized protein
MSEEEAGPQAVLDAMPASAPCLRCARVLGRSCCEADDGEALATLTRADIERIQQATHLRRAAFVEEEVLAEAEARAYEQRRPAWSGYFRAGPIRLTLARAHRACVFLDRRTGCTLDAIHRPTACLLYPFEPRADGGWTLSVEREASVALARSSGEPRCLAVEEAVGFPALFRAFNTSANSLRQLAERLRAEVRAHTDAGHGRPPA